MKFVKQCTSPYLLSQENLNLEFLAKLKNLRMYKSLLRFANATMFAIRPIMTKDEHRKRVFHFFICIQCNSIFDHLMILQGNNKTLYLCIGHFMQWTYKQNCQWYLGRSNPRHLDIWGRSHEFTSPLWVCYAKVSLIIEQLIDNK